MVHLFPGRNRDADVENGLVDTDGVRGGWDKLGDWGLLLLLPCVK